LHLGFEALDFGLARGDGGDHFRVCGVTLYHALLGQSGSSNPCGTVPHVDLSVRKAEAADA
jgi:hypothetical protein